MKILLIEDDKFFQNFYSLKLKEAGFEVETADDGIQGIEKIKASNPNLILLDLIMPGKDGFQVLVEKSNDETIKNIPVIVFSTLGQEQDVKKALSLGATDYINKTFFDFNNLSTKINLILSKNN